MAKRKVHTARPIQGNAGTKNKTARYLKRLSRGAFVLMAVETLRECEKFGTLDVVGGGENLASDWSLSRPRLDASRRTCERLARRLLKRFSLLNVPQRKQLANLIETSAPKWLGAMEEDLKHFLLWFSKTTAHDVTQSLRSSLEGAGVSRKFLKEKWSIPVGRAYVGETAKAVIPMIAEEAVASVVGFAGGRFEKLVEALRNDDPEFNREARLKTLLNRGETVLGDKSADLMALNMVNRMTQAINVANATDIGITHGRWIHVAGFYTSRRTHRHFDGQTFDLREGLFDNAVGRYVRPADLKNCRCTFAPLLPSEVLDYE